jgi:hypothetical protein
MLNFFSHKVFKILDGKGYTKVIEYFMENKNINY